MTVDLTSEYLGMTLATPIVAAACPLTGDDRQSEVSGIGRHGSRRTAVAV